MKIHLESLEPVDISTEEYYEEKDIETVLTSRQLITSKNIATLLTEDELSYIGREVVEDYLEDLDSRSEWEEKMSTALELAMQVQDDKTFPWPGASNVKFPLITIAALQYHSRAYPGLIQGTEVVKARILGDDPDGLKAAKGKRISEHMSYQILEEDENWEEQMDKVLIAQSIVGCAFKKSYFDATKGHNVSESVSAKDLVVPYYTKDLHSASRITHKLLLTQNDLVSRVNTGIYLDVAIKAPTNPISNNPLNKVTDNVYGTKPVESAADAAHDNLQVYPILEQHCYWDLDDDGYQEPYIVIVREDTKEVLRIVARYLESDITKFKGKITNIKATNYFTKFPFIPSPDGGFYDLGFGILLGPLNESINTLINQLIDAGTMANTAGGFLGRGVKIKSGDSFFKPMEWKRVDSTGDDLRKGIFALPVRDPSNVLFTLLELLINYGERIAGATDIMSGQNPGQNTTAEAARTTVEQGMKIFSSIFKRTYRSMKEEFRKLYKLNSIFLPDTTQFEGLSSGEVFNVSYQDYFESEKSIRPAADPDVTSDTQKFMQAQNVLQAVQMIPGMNSHEAGKMYLKALKLNDADIAKVLPENVPQAGPSEKMQIEQMRQKTKEMTLKIKYQEMNIKLMSEVEVNQAKIAKLRAESIKILGDAKGAEVDQQIAVINAQIGASKTKNEGIMQQLEFVKGMIKDLGDPGEQAGMAGMEAAGSDEGVSEVPQ